MYITKYYKENISEEPKKTSCKVTYEMELSSSYFSKEIMNKKEINCEINVKNTYNKNKIKTKQR